MQSQRSDILYRARNRIERFLARSSNAVGHRRYDTHAANSSNLCYWLLATGYLPTIGAQCRPGISGSRGGEFSQFAL
jgi:hypothetical protein